MKKTTLSWFMMALLSLIIQPFLSARTLAEETYKFERMWPNLQQPWYFYWPLGVAVGPSGCVYVAEAGGNCVVKLDSNGSLITKWGGPGSTDGEFSYPEGIAVDASGNVYVSERYNHRIQKFNANGQFISKMGSYGSGPGQFDGPGGLAFDSKGNMYVTDRNNHRIQKFDANGRFLLQWGSEGSGEGQFLNPVYIAIDSKDNVYVGEQDSYPNYHVQKFSSDGQFITKWGPEKWVYDNYKNFNWYAGIGIDKDDYVYVAWRPNLDKFTSDGQLVSTLSGQEYGGGGSVAFHGDRLYIGSYTGVASVSLKGEFLEWWGSSYLQTEEKGNRMNWPVGVTTDGEGNVYVVEYGANLAKFDSEGELIQRWSATLGDTMGSPLDVAVDKDGNIYLSMVEHVQKWSATGRLLSKFGEKGIGDGQFTWCSGLALDLNSNLYVVDAWNQRIQKFDSDGNFILKWGSAGTGDGQFNFTSGYLFDIAFDNFGSVYVADTGNQRIQKFTADGQFIKKWPIRTGQEGFGSPTGVAVDGEGNVYVVDKGNSVIQKYTSEGVFLAEFGSWGTNPGQMRDPEGITVDPTSEKVYVTDYGNNRVLVFSKEGSPPFTGPAKAIIVAGGGPYAGNNLWDATQMCANYAYRALTYQGYTKDTIYYLSADMDLDLDGNGKLDDVDADATNANLQYAINTWAEDANDLLIYMVDHGGNGTFRMSGTELLYATELDGWLDTLQQTLHGHVTLIYDACESGSFLPYLLPPSGKQRYVAASTSPGEESIFVGNGTVSFSFLFWGHMFNGESFYNSFVNAQKSVSTTYSQTCQLDANGNGIGNEKEDKDMASQLRIGNETKSAGDVPVIGGVSPAQSLSSGTSASIYADQVIDADGISRVWAVITHPDYTPGGSDTPVTDLPTLDLTSAGNSRYEGTYTGFTMPGAYNIAIFAMDRKGVLSLPVQTSVTMSATGGCLTVASDLSIKVPCAEYLGVPIRFHSGLLPKPR
ncbi:MAG: hypothetical protein K9N21_17510 [Deltaproteobacteria bacterium]|nr:hypothetical protein [Deltaproteobacteria bacterium]